MNGQVVNYINRQMRVWGKNINKSIESYLNSPYEKYKSYARFKFVKEIMERRLCKNNVDFLDIGCAKGEFIWYLKDFFPKMRFTGIEISYKLLSLAKKDPKLMDVKFIKADVQEFDLKKKYDFVLMSGVLSIFDDFIHPLWQMIKHLKSEGWGYIFGCFTEDDIDVLVRYRNNYLDSKRWESGLNMFSLSTIKKVLAKFSKKINFYKFNIPIDLTKDKNPIKSYTLTTREKGRIIVNGANILTPLYLVEFRRK